MIGLAISRYAFKTASMQACQCEAVNNDHNTSGWQQQCQNRSEQGGPRRGKFCLDKCRLQGSSGLHSPEGLLPYPVWSVIIKQKTIHIRAYSSMSAGLEPLTCKQGGAGLELELHSISRTWTFSGRLTKQGAAAGQTR